MDKSRIKLLGQDETDNTNITVFKEGYDFIRHKWSSEPFFTEFCDDSWAYARVTLVDNDGDNDGSTYIAMEAYLIRDKNNPERIFIARD
jgi:hypothetical protein